MRTIIIAEAGVNHNGNLKIAKQLVDVAKLAKADYVKFQSFSHDKLVTKIAPKANYQKSNFNNKETQGSMLQRLQLSLSDHLKLIDYCKHKKIKFLSTAFDIDNLKFLLKNKIDFIKIPSGEITNLSLLKYIKKKNKKILLSTGASTLNEVEKALIILNKSNKNITVLQCNSAYPTPIKDLNLNTLNTFKKNFNCNIGLSDHSLSTIVPAAAVAMGATIIEKHFTLSRKMIGPDHKSSLEPKELVQMIKNIREIEVALGNSKKIITKSEAENRKIIRKSLVAYKNISKGQKFTIKNVIAKRPAGGISPMNIQTVLGKRAIRNFKPDEIIQL
jgi:N,N'-diacetyllegionaminate synthase